MNIYPVIASGTTNGRLVKIAATAIGSATVLHTSVSGTTDIDEVTVWATNTSTSDVKLTLVLSSAAGSGTSPDDVIEYTVPAEDGLHLVVDRVRLNNAAVVEAFAGTTNVLNCLCTVNRVDFAG